jgi:serine/threonine protein kinase
MSAIGFDFERVSFIRDLYPTHPGTVNLCQTLSGQRVVIKYITSLSTDSTSTPTEIQAYEVIGNQTPHCVRVLGKQRLSSGIWRIALEYYQGRDLANLAAYAIHVGRKFPEDFAWLLLQDLIQGLYYLSSIGIEHTDLHSGNLLLKLNTHHSSHYPKIVLTDFGYANIYPDASYQPEYRDKLESVADTLLDNMLRVGAVDVDYSENLIDFVKKIAGSVGRLDSPTIYELVCDLYQRIPSSLNTHMPQWMQDYFDELENYSGANSAASSPWGSDQGG